MYINASSPVGLRYFNPNFSSSTGHSDDQSCPRGQKPPAPVHPPTVETTRTNNGSRLEQDAHSLIGCLGVGDKVNLGVLNGLWSRFGLFLREQASWQRPLYFLNGAMKCFPPDSGNISYIDLVGNIIRTFSQLDPYRFIRSPLINPSDKKAIIGNARDARSRRVQKWLGSNSRQEAALILLLRTGVPYMHERHDPRIRQERKYVDEWCQAAQRDKGLKGKKYDTEVLNLYYGTGFCSTPEVVERLVSNLTETLKKGVRHSPFSVLRSIPVVKEIFRKLRQQGVLEDLEDSYFREKIIDLVEPSRN